MSELRLSVKQGIGSISANFEELESQLKLKMEDYSGVIYTDETKNIAKEDIVNLRKLVKEIENRRIEIKKTCLEPYNDFEKKVKSLILLIDKPINLIDKQLKEFEEKRIKDKQDEIKRIYTELCQDVEDYLSFDKIYNKKWENVATTIKSITQDISRVVEDVQQAIIVIKGTKSEAIEKALEKYKLSLSLTEAIAYINNYEEQKQEIMRKEERRRLEEEKEKEKEKEKQADIERIRTKAHREEVKEYEQVEEKDIQSKLENKIENNVELFSGFPEIEKEYDECEKLSTNESNVLPFETASTVTVRYRVVALPADIEELETIMNSIGICFEREVLN